MDPSAAEYGEFLHNERQKMTSFDAIRAEIEVETGRYLKAKGRAVSPDPIQLTVYSPNVPNLTLVDMPGLTKIPIDGQPKSIVKELEDMARTYVKGDNAIILAVTPANADLATSDALHLAREVDPSGDRTIGVLTKLDIMDPGTDARDVLEVRKCFFFCFGAESGARAKKTKKNSSLDPIRSKLTERISGSEASERRSKVFFFL